MMNELVLVARDSIIRPMVNELILVLVLVECVWFRVGMSGQDLIWSDSVCLNSRFAITYASGLGSSGLSAGRFLACMCNIFMCDIAIERILVWRGTGIRFLCWFGGQSCVHYVVTHNVILVIARH